jgi:hypothetical protein
MDSGIYKICNKLNNRIYIGSTNCFRARKNQHLSELRRDKHENNFLQNDWNKCGEENFIFELIEVVPINDSNSTKLLAREQHYLDTYYDKKKTCYNINPIACLPPSWKGKKMSEEAKEKIRLSKIGERNHRFGTKISNSTKEKLIKNSRPKTQIFSINILTGEKKIFDGIGMAARFYNIHRNSISDRIRGRSYGPINGLTFHKLK